MTEEPSFGLPKNRTPLDRFIGKYVIIYSSKDEQNVGKLQKIDGEYVVINPFQGKEINEDGKFYCRLIDEDAIVRIAGIQSVEPTTRLNLERNCLRFNNSLRNQIIVKESGNLKSFLRKFRLK